MNFVVDGTTYPFPGSLANITIGVTPVVGGTTSNCLFVSGSVVGQQVCTLSAITSLTGDGTATGPGPAALTLATVNATTGTFGSSAVVPIITVNGKGLITNVSTTLAGITIGSSTIAGGATNSILYQNGGVFGELTAFVNAVLSTNVSGVPALSTTLPSALTIPSPTFTGTMTMPDASTWASTGVSKMVALSLGSATLPSAGRMNVSDQYQINGTQIAASNLSNGTTGSGSVVLAASPTLSGTVAGSITLSGNNTYSGNSTFSAQHINTGTSAPASAGGQVYIMGTIATPTLANTGQGAIYDTVVGGLFLQGDGSTSDITMANKGGTTVYTVPTGTTKLNFPALSVGTCSAGMALDSGNNTILTSCPGASSSIQVGATAVNSSTNNYILTAGTGTLANVAFSSLAPGGYINLFRNATLAVWQRGTTGLSDNGNPYTADGWIAAAATAAGTCSRDVGLAAPALFSLKCIGAASNTDTTIAQPIESVDAAKMAGATNTVQFQYKQTSGGSVTPKVSGCFASATDNFASCTADLAATSLTACATNTVCTEFVHVHG